MNVLNISGKSANLNFEMKTGNPEDKTRKNYYILVLLIQGKTGKSLN